MKRAFLTALISLFVPWTGYAQTAAPLSPKAQTALDNGLVAAREQQWDVAIRYFSEAQEEAPYDPRTLFNIALAESKVPGRELRSIAWFKAYLAASPDASTQQAVKEQVRALEIRVQSTMAKLSQQAKQAALQIQGGTKGVGSDEGYPYPSGQKYALFWVALAQADFGDFAGAKQTVSLIADQYTPCKGSVDAIVTCDLQGKALRKVAWGQYFLSGDLEGAKQTASTIADERQKDGALTDIAEWQRVPVSDRRLGEPAFDIVSMDTSNVRQKWRETMAAIASAEAKAGHLEAVRQIVDVIFTGISSEPDAYTYEASQALGMVAEAEAAAGDVAGAKETIDHATEVASSAGDYRCSAFENLARVQLKLGDITGAKEAFGRAKGAGLSCLEDVAEDQARAAQIADARETVSHISDPQGRCRALLAIAGAQFKAGDVAAARETIREAQEVASGISSPKDRCSALNGISWVQAKVGDVSAAKKTASSLCESERLNALANIADEQFDSGDVTGAKETASLLPADYVNFVDRTVAPLVKAGDSLGVKRACPQGVTCAVYLVRAWRRRGKSLPLWELPQPSHRASWNPTAT